MAFNTKNNMSSRATRPVKERVEFRMTPRGVMPSSISALQKLTIDAAMQAALTRASAKLVIEMDAGGTRVLLADQRNGQLIGGPEDLQKLGTIRAFVNRERKEATAVEAARDVTQLAFLAEKVVKDETPGFEMKPVDNSFAAAVRPLHAALLQTEENWKKVCENTSTNLRDLYEPELKRLFVGIENSYTDVISTLAKGGTMKGLLKERLFFHGVPEWVHSRFTAKTFALDRTGDLEKIFFTTDPTKGLSLTVKEWRDDEFLRKQEPLTRASTLLYNLITDDELLRAITGIAADVSLESEENPLVAKLLAAKATVLPLASSAARVIELGSKSKSAFKFPTPSMDTVTGAIVALSTAVLRVYSANLQSVDLVGDYYATIAPGAVKREDVTPTNNFYVQWGKAPNPSGTWRTVIEGGNGNMNLRQAVWRWLRMELRLSEKASAGKALASALELEEDGSIPKKGVDEHGLVTKDDDGEANLLTSLPSERKPEELVKQNRAVNLLRDLKDTEFPFWSEFQERVFPPVSGKKRPPAGVALTPLSPQGKQLLNRVAKVSPYVANRMLSWLRSFSDERLQLAAISVTNAEFDDIFTSRLDEEDEAESVLDWAEQEA
ncbi:hypothetical protein DMA14_00070 [Flavobacterium sharifuzzamanii]|nr:hypothetical protein DMA14_00070 [Flavobacterium sharifuzzamanii]